ncbi:MAG: hypothetical protein EBU59_13005, partial [Planctomycetia bacterium]|nr:hypothetical protein [Planctomycetia bacterium]
MLFPRGARYLRTGLPPAYPNAGSAQRATDLWLLSEGGTEIMLAVTEAAVAGGVTEFLPFVIEHWQFCLLHFLEFAIWGCWFVVLGNLLNARGFSRQDIGRIYGTMPIGSMISPLFIGPLAD